MQASKCRLYTHALYKGPHRLVTRFWTKFTRVENQVRLNCGHRQDMLDMQLTAKYTPSGSPNMCSLTQLSPVASRSNIVRPLASLQASCRTYSTLSVPPAVAGARVQRLTRVGDVGGRD